MDSIRLVVMVHGRGNIDINCDELAAVTNRAPEDADDDTGVVEYMMMMMPWWLVVPLPGIGVI